MGRVEEAEYGTMMIVGDSCCDSGGCYSTSLLSQFNLAINQVRLGDMGDRMMLEQSVVNMDEQVSGMLE